MRVLQSDQPLYDGKYPRDPYIESIMQQPLPSKDERKELEFSAQAERLRELAELQTHPGIIHQSICTYRNILRKSKGTSRLLQEPLSLSNDEAFREMIDRTEILFAEFLRTATLPPSKALETRADYVARLNEEFQSFPLRRTLIMDWANYMRTAESPNGITILNSLLASGMSAPDKAPMFVTLLASIPDMVATLDALNAIEGTGPVSRMRKKTLLSDMDRHLQGVRNMLVILNKEDDVDEAIEKENKEVVNVSAINRLSNTLLTVQTTLEEQIILQGLISEDDESKIALPEKVRGPVENVNDTQALIRTAMGMVVAIARTKVRPGVDLLDLIQQGNLFVIQRMRAHDPSRGMLTTYLWPYIGKHLETYIKKQHRYPAMDGIHRRPVSLESYVRDTEYAVPSRHEEDPAERMETRGHEWKYLKDTIPYPEEQESRQESEIEGVLLSEKIDEALKTLTYREREVIKLRYGLGSGYNYSLEEVGRIFKVTRERVRQIECKGIRKLQHPYRSKHLRHFVDNILED